MIFIGIDPGLNGGVACIEGVTGAAYVAEMPTMQKHSEDRTAKVDREVDALALARKLRSFSPDQFQDVLVTLEEVHAIHGYSIQSQGSLLDSFGATKAAVRICRMPLELVNPKRWKDFYALGPKKAESLALARKLYPGCIGIERAKDEGKAEALLIAHYGMKMATTLAGTA